MSQTTIYNPWYLQYITVSRPTKLNETGNEPKTRKSRQKIWFMKHRKKSLSSPNSSSSAHWLLPCHRRNSEALEHRLRHSEGMAISTQSCKRTDHIGGAQAHRAIMPAIAVNPTTTDSLQSNQQQLSNAAGAHWPTLIKTASQSHRQYPLLLAPNTRAVRP